MAASQTFLLAWLGLDGPVIAQDLQVSRSWNAVEPSTQLHGAADPAIAFASCSNSVTAGAHPQLCQSLWKLRGAVGVPHSSAGRGSAPGIALPLAVAAIGGVMAATSLSRKVTKKARGVFNDRRWRATALRATAEEADDDDDEEEEMSLKDSMNAMRALERCADFEDMGDVTDEPYDDSCYLEFEDEEGEEQADGVAEAEICEIMGFDLGEELLGNIGRPFKDEERVEARRECGFERAQSSDKPQAIWLIGPSASGKSTLAPYTATENGIAADNYVLVDGEPFRDAHKGYGEAIIGGQQLGCVWWGAYTNIRENVNLEKQEMLDDAMKAGKNLVIPSTCLRPDQCTEVVEKLQTFNYVIDIVGVYGDRKEIVRRGRHRASEKGKRYDPREFGIALARFPDMLRLCNGRWAMHNTTEPNSQIPTDEGEGPVSEEAIAKLCEKINAVCNLEKKKDEANVEKKEEKTATVKEYLMR